MSRQIHPGIFSDASQVPGATTGLYEPLPLLDAAAPDMHQVQELIQKHRFEVDQSLKSMGLRLEKALTRMQSLEDKLNQIVGEVKERLSFVTARVRERQTLDARAENVIDRHNQIIQSFELKMSQAQKVIDNQALQLAKQQDLLDEARRQLERLKKV